MKYLLASLMGLTSLVASGCQTSTQSTCGTNQNSCGTGRCFTICLPARECSCRKTPNLFGRCGSGSCNQKCESNCNADNKACCPPTPTLMQRWQGQWNRPQCQASCKPKCENNCPPTPTLRDQWRNCSNQSCEPCQCGHQRRLFGYNRCDKGSCGTSCSKCEQPVCQPSEPTTSPCPAPSKPVYCRSCDRTPIIVQQPGTVVTTLPPIATSVPTQEVAKTPIADTPANLVEVSPETRTIVGSLRYDAKANVWHLRHVSTGVDDQKVSEVALKGIEPYVNSLRDRMTVSIRGELTTAATSTQSAAFTVSEVNIVGQ